MTKTTSRLTMIPPEPLKGAHICITGNLELVNTAEAKEALKSIGVTVRRSISDSVHCVVVGRSPSKHKLELAAQYGVTHWNEGTLISAFESFGIDLSLTRQGKISKALDKLITCKKARRMIPMNCFAFGGRLSQVGDCLANNVPLLFDGNPIQSDHKFRSPAHRYTICMESLFSKCPYGMPDKSSKLLWLCDSKEYPFLNNRLVSCSFGRLAHGSLSHVSDALLNGVFVDYIDPIAEGSPVNKPLSECRFKSHDIERLKPRYSPVALIQAESIVNQFKVKQHLIPSVINRLILGDLNHLLRPLAVFDHDLYITADTRFKHDHCDFSCSGESYTTKPPKKEEIKTVTINVIGQTVDNEKLARLALLADNPNRPSINPFISAKDLVRLASGDLSDIGSALLDGKKIVYAKNNKCCSLFDCGRSMYRIVSEKELKLKAMIDDANQPNISEFTSDKSLKRLVDGDLSHIGDALVAGKKVGVIRPSFDASANLYLIID